MACHKTPPLNSTAWGQDHGPVSFPFKVLLRRKEIGMYRLITADNKYVLLGGRSYVVGRRDCDVILSGDPTVSRKHAELTMSHAEANLANVTKLPMVLLKDLSKFGTWVNKEKVNGEKILSDGDEITFGSSRSLYTVVYEPMVITSSCLDNAGKKSVRQQLCILGGHMVNEWSNDCSLVVMNKISVTIKVICALISLKSVVLPSYLEQYVKYLQGSSEKPEPESFTPALAETQLNPDEVSFVPDKSRKILFQGMKFIFLSEKQLKKLGQAIELAGGMPLLMETKGDDGTLLEQGTVVMNCQESDLTPKAVKWAKHVHELLDSHGKHMIQDAEIGYAVLYSSTDKHCNPDYTPDRALSRLPSQSLSQADVFAANTDTQTRTQTQGRSQRNKQKSQQQNIETTPAKASSPGPSEQRKSSRKCRSPSPGPIEQRKSSKHSSSLSPGPTEQRKSSRHSRSPSPVPTTELQKSSRHTRSPSPAKSSSPGPSKRQRTSRHSESPFPEKPSSELAKRGKPSRHSRSPSPTPQMAVKVKEEPKTQPTQPHTAASTKKRNRPVIEDDDSDEEFPVSLGRKRVKVEPETPRSQSRRAERQKNSAVSDNSDDDLDEFDKIDVRMNSKRTKKTSPKPASHTPPSVSPSRAERVSPVRQNNRKSPSPHIETVSKNSHKVKAEVTDVESPYSDLEAVRSSQGQTRSGINSGTGGSRSERRGVKKTEVESNEYEMSAVVPVEDSEDTKPAVVYSRVPRGFLSTERPIQDQVPRNREFESEPDQPSNCVKVEVVSLVVKKPAAKVKDSEDCPDGFTRWKGKVVRNMKKFRKVHPSGHMGLPTIIGGSDLEVYVPQRSKEMDDWFKETMQAESQHASEDRRAQELFDFDPSRRRGR